MIALFLGVAAGCGLLAIGSEAEDRPVLVAAAFAWAVIAVLAFRLGEGS